MFCVGSSSVTDSTVPHSPRKLSAMGVCAKARRIGLLPVEGMLVNLGNVSEIAGWTSYQGLGKLSLGMGLGSGVKEVDLFLYASQNKMQFALWFASLAFSSLVCLLFSPPLQSIKDKPP